MKKEYKKESYLDGQHWQFEDYSQRMTSREWKEILLNGDDRVIFKGKVTDLKCKNLGFGVVEISKVIK